jgi:hypothetical protein
MMIGAKDLAFPRINLLSWYIYLLGGLITIYALPHPGRLNSRGHREEMADKGCPDQQVIFWLVEPSA